MKRSIYALAFCISLLTALSAFLFFPASAKENVISALLNLPAPPPPNPLVEVNVLERDQKFYSKSNPPKDNAPIGELLDYWKQINGTYDSLRYSPEPSEKVRERILAAIGQKPKLLPDYLRLMERDQNAIDFVKRLYDREQGDGTFGKEDKSSIRRWLTYNSPEFSGELAGLASRVSDTDGYVTNQDELLALTRVDFDKARPLIDRINNDSSLKTSRVLAKWALYRHALDTDSLGDIEQYRDELKSVVEDRSALPGMRDLAMDALVSEKEWSGRDDWYMSLLADETLSDLKVNGTTYTGLTTLMLVSPDEKYIEKMCELAQSSNLTIRSAAVRNLITRLESGRPEVIKALLPWLEDPNWAVETTDTRGMIVRKLSEIEIRESVPGLLTILDEKRIQKVNNYGANMPANAANAVSAANAAIANAVKRMTGNFPVAKDGVEVVSYPYRYSAVGALGKQKDGRAIPVLRRILPEGEGYERAGVVGALLACGGFSVAEQLDALEAAADLQRGQIDASRDLNTASIPYLYGETESQGIPSSNDSIKFTLGQQVLQLPEISDQLARAIVDRIEILDQKDPRLALVLRAMILKWQNAAINLLLLSDLKRDAASVETIVRLLGQRADLREKQSSDVYELRSGKPVAVGIAACLLEDTAEYSALLENGDPETKTALFACARLIRAPLPIAAVAENLKSPSQSLQMAAELYLESEDSPEARRLVLERHPNEAKILGATTAFFVEGSKMSESEYLWMLYRSLGNTSLYYGWVGTGSDQDLRAAEKRLQTEVIKDGDLLGIYSYDGNYIRIYKDRVIFSWDEDNSRYRERPLNKEEFDEIKSYLTVNKVDELPPFLTCGGEYCGAKELVMLGRNGGRRIFVSGTEEVTGARSAHKFFAGLENYFERLKQTRATLKYALSRDIPGLEILIASDDLYALTVWSGAGELRVAASETAVRKKVRAEIEGSDPESDIANEEPISELTELNKAALYEKRRYEGVGWYKVLNGEVAGGAAQPPLVEFIPVRSGSGAQPGEEQWKARGDTVEIRTSDEGLFKVVGGKQIRLKKGDYRHALVTPNGRWAIVYRADGENEGIVRVDLLTNKEYPVVLEGYGERVPVAYVPTLNKFLIVPDDQYEGYSQDESSISPSRNDADPAGMVLIDPATGAVQPIAGEFRPLSQQTFRPLQKTSKQSEYWAAVYNADKNATEVGPYEIRTFGFTPVVTIPKIKFNSMDMWVDGPAGKLYFVYKGHLLVLPLK